MKIGELADQTGLSQSRIRFYEKVGLLKAVGRRSNGYRVYTPGAAVILRVITEAQSAGFSLEEIRVLLPSELERWDHDALLGTLRRKVADITSFEVRLGQSKARFLSIISAIENRPDDIDCATNAQRVLAHLFESHDGPSEGQAR